MRPRQGSWRYYIYMIPAQWDCWTMRHLVMRKKPICMDPRLARSLRSNIKETRELMDDLEAKLLAWEGR